MLNIKIGEKIKKIRLSKNMSQERFGSKIGVSGKSISAYENNLCIPSMKVMESISSIYEIPIITTKSRNELINKIENAKCSLKELEIILDKTLSL
jgi:transcriptional regulator with XRE-family HTH domain